MNLHRKLVFLYKVFQINNIIHNYCVISESKRDICNKLNVFYINVGYNLDIVKLNNNALLIDDNRIISSNIFFNLLKMKK